MSTRTKASLGTVGVVGLWLLALLLFYSTPLYSQVLPIALGTANITSTLTCQTPVTSDPPNPATGLLLYCKLSGGKVSLNVRFPTGGAQQLAIEP